MANNKDGTSGVGEIYESRMCLFLFVRGYIRGLTLFEMRHQVKDAGQLDDIVFNDGSGMYMIFQLKHKENENKLVNDSNLFTDTFNTPYNLIKYVKSVLKANSTQLFQNKINAAIVFTNIELKANVVKPKLTALDPSIDNLELSSLTSHVRYYKFTDDPNIATILEVLAKELAEDVGPITEDEIRDALEKLYYAVKQPNILEIEQIIKNDLKDHFKLHNADSIYEKLNTYFQNWCGTKNLIGEPSTSIKPSEPKQPNLTYQIAHEIFEKNVKKISFGNRASIDAFTGRSEQLSLIKEELFKSTNKKQTVVISGLGGIGKTQLVRQFIELFCHSEFYGRIIWIDAESDGSITSTLETLAKQLETKNSGNKDVLIKTIIDEIFGYFKGFKVLFVFDNFDSSPVYKGNLVKSCWNIANDPTKKYLPYFIFTSRNRECLPGIPTIDLDILSLEEAKKLIENELAQINLSETDIKKLAEDLQCFPLALQQAIAYIKEKHKGQKKLGKQYKIQTYFDAFATKTPDLLEWKYVDDFGDEEKKATYITLKLAVDAIGDDKVHGENAIKVIRIFAYLCAEKVDSNMFLPLFGEENTIQAISLLDKYSMITQIEDTSFYQIHRLVQTVVQINFNKNEDKEELFEKTCELIFPELYKKAFDNYGNYNEKDAFDLIKNCSDDQLLHYKTLSVYMMKIKALEKKYEDFFSEINYEDLLLAAHYDDVDKISAMRVSTKYSRKFIKTYFDDLVERNSNNVIKYFIKNKFLEVNDEIKGKTMIKWTMEKDNVQIFKFLIEENADYKEVLENASKELVSKVIRGEYSTKSFKNQKVINECLFYATLFDQKSIVRFLLEKNEVKNNPKFKEWSLIYVAAMFGHTDILESLVSKCDKEHLKQCLNKLMTDRYFSDKKSFEIITNKHREKGGYFNYEAVNYYEKFGQTKGEILNFLSNIVDPQICMLLFVRGYIRGLKDFKLEYQMEVEDTFIDFLFEDGSGERQMVQFEQKDDQNETKITNSNFIEKFNLIKNVKTVINATVNPKFKDKIITQAILTNNEFNLENDKSNISAELDSILIFKTSAKAKFYKITDNSEIVEALMKDISHANKDQIRAALDKLIYGAQQINVQNLSEIIKKEIKDYFKLYDVDTIYSILAEHFRVWCESKNSFGQPSTSTQSNTSKQPVLTYADADKFFRRRAKVVSFGVTAPTDAFTGRIQELEQIRQQLNEGSSVIVSQSVTISGLGGIGKTQLTRQFVEQLGKSDYCSRVIWIEAQSDESVKNSFELLAQVLKIQDARNKDPMIIIYDVFQYFEGCKVLFVFDNFDKSPAYKGSLVTYCLKVVSDPKKKDRPYFLFTSRNRECVPGAPILDLSVLSPEDAVQLIKNELVEIKLTDDEAERLAEMLQYFPLALRQANAYIKKQHEIKKAFGKKYDIQEYLENFHTKEEELLNFEFPDGWKIEQTTFITWYVTLDAIKADKVHGENAIKVLRFCAYIYADKLDLNMFLSLFGDDKTKTYEAFELLKNYSMITQIEQEESTFYQIHRLVQTVIRLKFQNDNVPALLEKTCRLINPELYDVFNNQEKDNENVASDLMKKCSLDQLVHFNTLSVHMMKIKALEEKYEDFFSEINNEVLIQAAHFDDVDKISAMKVSTKNLRKFIESYFDDLVERNSNNVIKYSIKNQYLEVNDQIKGKTLIKWSVEKDNVQIFKYLLEQKADYKEVLENASEELVSKVIRGEHSLESFNINQEMINECLFYATLFGQKSIVEFLSKQRKIERNPKFKGWSLLYVAAMFGHTDILELLAPNCDKEHLRQCLNKLTTDRNFSDKKSFEIITNKHHERPG